MSRALLSPFEYFIRLLLASLSISIFLLARIVSVAIAWSINLFKFSSVRDFNSKTYILEIRALFTSKYGFSVVAPISMMVESSTKGRR